jgi:multiple sugar transport system substrate-binding protein
MSLRRAWIALFLTIPFLLVAACGDDSGGSGGGGESADGGGSASGSKVIDPASMEGAKGNITFCGGKDVSGSKTAGIEQFNAQNPGITAKLLEFPESADEQRNQFVQRQEARSADCDVFYSDVVWTAEFAIQDWLYDMTPYVEQRREDFIESTLATATYEDKIWGVPHKSNAGFLYYRTDQVDAVPETWQAVYDLAAKNDGIAYQGAAYEGLTVNFLELAFAAGGEVLSEDGKTATINSRENLRALEFMVDGIKRGAAPQSVTTFMEEPARRAFESGRVTFLRNWPYVFATANKAEATKGNFKVAPFPAFEGGGTAGILGGANLVISTYSKNPGAALKFIDYMTHEERQTEDVVKFSDASPLVAVYDDPNVQEAQPFALDLRTAIEQSRSRPVSPVYPQISEAIYKNINEALSGAVSPEEALKSAQTQIQAALQTF